MILKLYGKMTHIHVNYISKKSVVRLQVCLSLLESVYE